MACLKKMKLLSLMLTENEEELNTCDASQSHRAGSDSGCLKEASKGLERSQRHGESYTRSLKSQ